MTRCSGCHRGFTNIGTFRRHKMLDERCRHPDDIGLVPYLIHGDTYWGSTNLTKEDHNPWEN